MTVPYRCNFKADILPVAYTGQQKTTNGQTCYDCEESFGPWSSEWCDTDGYDDEYFPEETDWNENYYETSDYDDNDNTFSEHNTALLDQPVETREEDTSKLETVQEALAAANAAADMSRRTWTQARQLMKDVHVVSFLSQRAIRWTSIKAKESHVARRDVSVQEKECPECKESLLKDWFVHRGRPRLIRMDPDGCYMSNEMLNTLHHDLGQH